MDCIGSSEVYSRLMEEQDPSENLITNERLNKGDLDVVINAKGKISRALPKRLTIMKELIRVGKFPYHYEIYGLGFLELRSAFLYPWSAKGSTVLGEQWGLSVTGSKGSEIYQHVCRGLGIRRIDTIEYVIDKIERRNSIEGAEKNWVGLKIDRRVCRLDGYKDCFETLISIMDEEREKVFKNGK